MLDILAKRGHGHLLPPELEDSALDEGSEVDDIDTPPMSPYRRIIIGMAQKMQLEPQGGTAPELLNPPRAATTTPQCGAVASPVKQSPTALSLAQQMSGRQMDASRNQRAQSKRTSSPAPLDPNKCAKTPTRESDKAKQEHTQALWQEWLQPELTRTR